MSSWNQYFFCVIFCSALHCFSSFSAIFNFSYSFSQRILIPSCGVNIIPISYRDLFQQKLILSMKTHVWKTLTNTLSYIEAFNTAWYCGRHGITTKEYINWNNFKAGNLFDRVKEKDFRSVISFLVIYEENYDSIFVLQKGDYFNTQTISIWRHNNFIWYQETFLLFLLLTHFPLRLFFPKKYMSAQNISSSFFKCVRLRFDGYRFLCQFCKEQEDWNNQAGI